MCDCAEQIHGRLIVRKIQDDRSDFVWTFGKRAQCLLLGRGVHEFTPATGRGMLNRQVALGIVDSNDKEGFHVRRLRREEIRGSASIGILCAEFAPLLSRRRFLEESEGMATLGFKP